MNAIAQIEGRGGEWLFVTPVGNLLLTEAVDHEFRVDGVLFVARKKLPRLGKRFGFDLRLAEIKRSLRDRDVFGFGDFFDQAETYAVVKQGGKPSPELQREWLDRMRDAAAMVSASQLGYCGRGAAARVAVLGEHGGSSVRYFVVSRDGDSHLIRQKDAQDSGPLVLGGLWKQFQKQAFFRQLAAIVNGEIPVDEEWRETLKRAAVLIGRGMNTDDVPTAFLGNMIVLEMLLAKAEDKFEHSIPDRIDAFLGWASPAFHKEHGRKGIVKLYNLRSRLVHGGYREDVTRRHLLFSDALILNLLANVTGFPALFPSKASVIEFVERLGCEQKLGLRPKVHPRSGT